MIYNAIIAGGGASGIVAAIKAAEKIKQNTSGKQSNEAPGVLIIDKNKKLGRKLYATGNGRCNISNAHFDISCYNSSQEFFPYEIINNDSYRRVNDFFFELGVPSTDTNGYFYPMSLQASTVVWSLSDRIKSLGIEVRLKEEVTGITGIKNVSIDGENLFKVTTDKGTYQCRNLIISTGGSSYESLGGSDTGYKLLETTGHRMIPVYPALCKLKCSRNISGMNGLRTAAEARLTVDDIEYGHEQGELQISGEYLSGIMIFNLSSQAVRCLHEGHKVKIYISLVPELTEEEIEKIIINSKSANGDRTVFACLNGMLNERAVQYVMDIAGEENRPVKNITDKEAAALAHTIKNLEFDITGHGDYSEAQVVSGGADTSYFNPVTMESKLLDGLFVTGEALDVDGICGGYNITWAVITGMAAGEGIHI